MDYCELARDVAQKSLEKMHHGAILIKGNEIISTGYNDYKNHAEENAIQRASWVRKGLNHRDIRRRMRKCVLIVVRSSKDALGNSKPCRHCLDMIQEYGIKKVYYSVDSDTVMVERSNQMHTDYYSSRYRHFFGK